MNLTPINAANSPYTPPASSLHPTTRSQKTGDFLSGAVPAALLGGLQGLTTSTAAKGALATSTSTTATALGTAASATSLAGGIYGALQLMANWGRSSPSAGASSGMALGATIGSCIAPGIGTALGAGIGALAGGLIGGITSGKHRDQKVRDAVRDVLVQSQILNDDYLLPLADGSTYDLGKDGGPRAEFGGRRPYELDFQNPLVQHAVAWMNPIIELLSQGNRKIHVDFVGYFANAAVSNANSLADVKRNVDSFMTRFGLSNETLAQAIVRLAQSGRIDQSTAQAYIKGIAERAHVSVSHSVSNG
jgi:hypothetical protein